MHRRQDHTGHTQFHTWDSLYIARKRFDDAKTTRMNNYNLFIF